MSSAQAKQVLERNIINSRDVNLTNINSTHYSSQRDFMEILKDHAALGALHDSAERFDPPKCHPETRTAVLDHIGQWAQDMQNGKPILWLSGAAGAGKSAIAQTLIERWKKEKLPTICFFFWRTSTKRNQMTHFIPTIAFQIANLFPAIKPSIETVIRTGDIFERCLHSQMDELIVTPLHDCVGAESPVIVVIDGLDECCVDIPKDDNHPGQDHESQQKEILDAIAFACQKSSSLRFFVASRPERQIRQSFNSEYLIANTCHISLNDSPNMHADIRLFLDCKFAEIRKNNPGLDPSWPSEQQLSLLVDKSSGQFIYPSTVMKFVGRPRQNPQLSLEAVLELKGRPRDPHAEHALEEIDALYSLVLGSVVPTSWCVVKDILGELVYGPGTKAVVDFKIGITHHWATSLEIMFADLDLDRPWSTLAFFQRYFFLSLGDLHAHLVDVHSILDIPGVAQESGPIRFMHATLSEFLRDRARSQMFFIDEEQYFLRRQLLSHRHVQQCFSEESALYSKVDLVNLVALCSHACPPSKEVRIYLWNLMKDEIGPYPALPLPSFFAPDPKNHENQMSSELSRYLGTLDKLLILYYFKKCNIPKIEPSWLRRSLVRMRLKPCIVRARQEWGREERERERRWEREEREGGEWIKQVGKIRLPVRTRFSIFPRQREKARVQDGA